MLGTEKFGSKMDCRNLLSARIMASWTVSDGLIDISAARRPGIVTFYIVHNVKINENFVQHVFAVVWWNKADEDQYYFGKPVQVWKLDEYEPCGPALFMPEQRIAQRYACCSVTLHEQAKLVISSHLVLHLALHPLFTGRRGMLHSVWESNIFFILRIQICKVSKILRTDSLEDENSIVTSFLLSRHSDQAIPGLLHAFILLC